ncbi:Phospholipase D [Phytophthora cinnamomi]|uniref:Phospholipase D n=1 Tax=Phytophthora cinnamomi TaxID=4785 RepID=UPI00355A7522|nr:Phospholipase D [Phytophthora cinnamomi]
MDAILSRVGVSDAQLRRHCEAAVLDELQQADARVRDVVAALERALKVVRASRELHQALVLTASDPVQASFRCLGASCNQIGPLLRLLHRDMSATASASPEQPEAMIHAAQAVAAVPTVSVVERSETKPPAPRSPEASASSTASEYEVSSDEESDEDDDEPEVVEVSPPSSSSRKRKAVTLDLSQSAPPAVRRKTPEEDTQTVRDYLTNKLKEARALPMDGYSVATHNELAALVKKVFAAADTFDAWQPRDDPTLAQLLNEMEKRMGVFKDSVAQVRRCKAVSDWQREMTASAFVPSLDLVSMPRKIDSTRGGTGLSQEECVRLERLLYLLRLVMFNVDKFRIKAAKLIPDILKLFPPAVRPRFRYPNAESKQPQQEKHKQRGENQSKQGKKNKKRKKKKSSSGKR